MHLHSRITRLGLRLLFRVALVILVTGLLLLASNGYQTWQEVEAAQKNRLQEIRQNLIPPLVADLWQFDDAKIGLQLEVIARMLPEATVTLDTSEGQRFRAGQASPPAESELHVIDLRHPESAEHLATLTLTLDRKALTDRLLLQIRQDLTQHLALLALLAAALVFFVHSLIVRRLRILARTASTFDPDSPADNEDLPLWPAQQVRDEIDDLNDAFSRMRKRIRHDVDAARTLESELTRQALHDPLTGLGNRAHLAARARNYLQQTPAIPVAFVFIDIDRLKLINDSLGHVIGDRLLRALARRMEAILPEHCELFRPGSDEFLLLLPDPHSPPGLAQLAADLQRIMSVPFRIDPHELSITISIGAALSPEHGSEQSLLLRHADIALQAAKRQGRGNTCIFNPQLLASLNERVQIESLLRQAIERNELSLHFQPQIDLASGHLIGAEALLRWHSHEIGNIPPDRFIPIAEDCGLIVSIGAWVLHAACRTAGDWQQQGISGLRLSVNLSAVQLRHPEIAPTIAQALSASGLPAEQLEIEVTESVIMDDVQQAAGQLAALRALGVRIAIDDFGTGYSSLAYLKHLPIDSLKIDRAFITEIPGDANDTAIAIAIIRMAEALRLAVVAEGVESAEQAELLKSERCHLAQGYLFAKPLPAEQFIAFAQACRASEKMHGEKKA